MDDREENRRIANCIIAVRFDFFQHVPDPEKLGLCRLLLRSPLSSDEFCKVLDSLIKTNQICKVRHFLGSMKRHSFLHRSRSDADEILEIFWMETDDRKVAHDILTHLLNPLPDERLRRMAKNLLFSASCYQDKLAALCLLDG